MLTEYTQEKLEVTNNLSDLMPNGRVFALLPFVMRDDDQLEVLLLSSGHHYVAQSLCQAGTVLSIQVGGGLIQRQDAAVQAESLGQC